MSAAAHRRQAEGLLEQAATTSSDYDKTLALMQANLHASLAISEDLTIANRHLRDIVATDNKVSYEVTPDPDADERVIEYVSRFLGKEFRQ